MKDKYDFFGTFCKTFDSLVKEQRKLLETVKHAIAEMEFNHQQIEDVHKTLVSIREKEQ